MLSSSKSKSYNHHQNESPHSFLYTCALPRSKTGFRRSWVPPGIDVNPLTAGAAYIRVLGFF